MEPIPALLFPCSLHIIVRLPPSLSVAGRKISYSPEGAMSERASEGDAPFPLRFFVPPPPPPLTHSLSRFLSNGRSQISPETAEAKRETRTGRANDLILGHPPATPIARSSLVRPPSKETVGRGDGEWRGGVKYDEDDDETRGIKSG